MEYKCCMLYKDENIHDTILGYHLTLRKEEGYPCRMYSPLRHRYLSA